VARVPSGRVPPARATALVSAAAAWLACAAAWTACAPQPSPPSHVVLVLIDQLRHDAADRSLVQVGELASRGVVFEEMRSAAPWTYPSVVSLMSGLHPQQHGALLHPNGERFSRFDAAVPLLQQRLDALGWDTAAFVTNPYLFDWNPFHRGFDHFDAHFLAPGLESSGEARIAFEWSPETMFADSVNDAVRAHFDARPVSARELSYVHYIDVHGPWQGAPFAADYDAAIRFVDARVAELHAYFTKRYAGDVVFIVTSDHGRELGDDTAIGDGPRLRRDKHSVHDFNLRVPFLILPSEAVPVARRISGPASHVDVVPTLLDWLAIEDPVARPGTSLLAAIRDGARLDPARPTYAREWGAGVFSDALVIDGRKYVRFFRSAEGGLARRQIFDLRADPREITSAGDRFGEVGVRFRDAAGDHGLAFAPIWAAPAPGIEATLRALGYLAPEAPDAPLQPGEGIP
jgi:arylsulfatase A-like enzyme